jgi:hypothetical protein
MDVLEQEATSVRYAVRRSPPVTFTFGEMFQVLDVMLGRRTLPGNIRGLACHPRFRSIGRTTDFRDVDVVLVEPASPVDLIFRGYNINRAGLHKRVKSRIEKLGSEEKKLADRWYRAGLANFDDEVRAEAAARLLARLPPRMKHIELIRAVVDETRSSKADVVDGLRRVRDLVGRPVGVVVYVFQYLADGRAISWPQGFYKDVINAARELDLPVFEPAQSVNRFGVEAALRPGLRHYTDEFTKVIAHELAEFAHGVAETAGAAQADRRMAADSPLAAPLRLQPLRRILSALR